MDGTLLDYETTSHVALNEGLPDQTQEVDWDLHGEIVGTNQRHWAPFILGRLGYIDPENVDQTIVEKYIHDYHVVIEREGKNMVPMSGALALLDRLEEDAYKHIRLAIATSSELPAFTKKMAFHPRILRKRIEVVITGDRVVNGKVRLYIFTFRSCTTYEETSIDTCTLIKYHKHSTHLTSSHLNSPTQTSFY